MRMKVLIKRLPGNDDLTLPEAMMAGASGFDFLTDEGDVNDGE